MCGGGDVSGDGNDIAEDTLSLKGQWWHVIDAVSSSIRDDILNNTSTLRGEQGSLVGPRGTRA